MHTLANKTTQVNRVNSPIHNRRTILACVFIAVVLLSGLITGMVYFGDFLFNLDIHLGEIIAVWGALAYAILFGIIFIETGLVFIPFLPGDSLLFVAGAFAATGSLNVFILLVLLISAAILGDTTNYWIGHFFGKRIEADPKMPINKKHIENTRKFFARHGGKTIVLARFVPIIRTFAPFVAGAGRMSYRRFLFYNVIGGIFWVAIGIVAGYFFGNVPLIKNNFTSSIFGIVLISIIPILITFLRGKRRSQVTRLHETSEPNNP